MQTKENARTFKDLIDFHEHSRTAFNLPNVYVLCFCVYIDLRTIKSMTFCYNEASYNSVVLSNHSTPMVLLIGAEVSSRLDTKL